MCFRNHHNAMFEFTPGLNILWGENGSGKTAIIEAIHLLSIGRSFRTNRRKDLLQYGQDSFKINGTFLVDEKTDVIRLNQVSDGKRKMFVNDVPIEGLKEIVGKHPVVLLSPEEQTITKGGPQDRRQYFDKMFSVVSPEYLEKLVTFQRVLKQRNAALQLCRENRAGVSEIETWEEPLAVAAASVWKMRKSMIAGFSTCCKKAVHNYGETDAFLEVGYESKNPGAISEILNALKNQRRKDIINSNTETGPHRDRYSFVLNGKDIRSFASQGEHKLALVLIKLAELYYVKERQGAAPVFLLDDLLAKLDFKRGQKVLSLLEKTAQTIVTTTDIVQVKNRRGNLSAKEHTSIHLEKKCKV